MQLLPAVPSAQEADIAFCMAVSEMLSMYCRGAYATDIYAHDAPGNALAQQCSAPVRADRICENIPATQTKLALGSKQTAPIWSDKFEYFQAVSTEVTESLSISSYFGRRRAAASAIVEL
jgi:hypothetical protein